MIRFPPLCFALLVFMALARTSAGSQLVGGDRPYIKFASNGDDEIHFIVNDGHPRWTANNSVYHAYYKDGNLHASDGTIISSLDQGLATASEATLIYQGDAINRSWVTDIALDPADNPVAVFSVQVELDGHHDAVNIDPDEGFDHRYYYGKWDGGQWQVNEMAFAGTRLFEPVTVGNGSAEDYTGLAAIDPDDVNTVYISTNADPVTGAALVSSADSRRHFEIFKGVTGDDGSTWAWTAITENSDADNIRPIVPKWDDQNTAILWARGSIISSANYDLDIVGIISGVDSVFGLPSDIVGDLNQDGVLDPQDWGIYRDGFQLDLSGVSPEERYLHGDMNADGVNDWDDFDLFKIAYNDANGAGAFAAMLSSVPEPSSLALLVLGLVASAYRCRHRSYHTAM